MFDGPTADALAAFHRLMEDESRGTPRDALQLQEGNERVFVGGGQVRRT